MNNGWIQINEKYGVYESLLFGEGSCPDEFWRVYPLDERFLVSDMARCIDMKRQCLLKDYPSADYTIWYMGDYTENELQKRSIMRSVHRVVAETWCEKLVTDQRLVVDHKDGNKKNNLADNLVFKTYKQNSNSQDVQNRKAKSLKKTLEHAKDKNALVQAIAQINDKAVSLEIENVNLENKLTEAKRIIVYLEEELVKYNPDYKPTFVDKETGEIIYY